MSAYAGYQEVVPDQQFSENWKTVVINTGKILIFKTKMIFFITIGLPTEKIMKLSYWLFSSTVFISKSRLGLVSTIIAAAKNLR